MTKGKVHSLAVKSAEKQQSRSNSTTAVRRCFTRAQSSTEKRKTFFAGSNKFHVMKMGIFLQLIPKSLKSCKAMMVNFSPKEILLFKKSAKRKASQLKKMNKQQSKEKEIKKSEIRNRRSKIRTQKLVH